MCRSAHSSECEYNEYTLIKHSEKNQLGLGHFKAKKLHLYSNAASLEIDFHRGFQVSPFTRNPRNKIRIGSLAHQGFFKTSSLIPQVLRSKSHSDKAL